MTEKLLPCPWCGVSKHYHPKSQVACLGCGAHGPINDPKGIKWNALPRDTPWIKIGEGQWPDEWEEVHVWDALNQEKRIKKFTDTAYWRQYWLDAYTHYKLIPEPGTPDA